MGGIHADEGIALYSRSTRMYSLEQGATLVVNPMTAVIFFDIIKQGRHRAFVNTAAASQLGRMLLRMANKRNIPIINIVRREEQADLLRSLGAEHVLVSTDSDFDQKLSTLTHRLNATLVLDAISGAFTQRLVDASPPNSLILLYSNLSASPAQIMPNSLWNSTAVWKVSILPPGHHNMGF